MNDLSKLMQVCEAARTVMLDRAEWLKQFSHNGIHMKIDSRACAGSLFKLALEIESHDVMVKSLLEEVGRLRAEISWCVDWLRKPAAAVSDEDVERAIDAYDASWSDTNRGYENKQISMRAALEADRAGRGDRKRCEYCDDTGDVHGIDGEWRGACTACDANQVSAQGQGGTLDARSKAIYAAIPKITEVSQLMETMKLFGSMTLLQEAASSLEESLAAAPQHGTEGE